MHKDIKEDIHRRNLKYTMISLFSSKVNILVIGAGKAALIKTKAFLSNGCNVNVIAKDVDEEFYKLDSEKINIIKGEYSERLLKHNHVVVIAIDDDILIDSIKRSCEKLDKIYINCKNSRDGMAVLPLNFKSDEVFLGINTLRGNPKASKMLGNHVIDKVKEFDDFIKVTSIIRNNVKSIKEKKNEILDFIINDDFRYIVNKKKERLVLELFYEKELVDKLFKD